MSVSALSSHQLSTVTDKVNRLLTLSRDAHEELDFVISVTLADNEQSPSTPVRRSYPPCRPVAIPLAGTGGSPDSYLKDIRGSGP